MDYDAGFTPYGDYGGQEYVASPCCGRANVVMGHVYEIRKRGTGAFEVVAYMPLLEALATYGTDNVFVSTSKTMCQDCIFAMLESHAANKKRESSEPD